MLTVLILWHWLTTMPPLPSTTDEASLTRYQRLTELHQQHHRDMFQVMVTSAFLPLVSAVLGYLFGIQRSETTADSAATTDA
ncbi:hypothetical protein [Deinococcus sp. 12RED42]|uniref:hypothetical protein n=1 Tax=Deinococcus sp. 12RED42 TaxID=2745872 RepID=UPI001E4D6BE3|nr:hypothetical protein [Deinococcus sp. 12RED42]MCD0164235.1 hypothetical protein [Deinococcus sp. 12RED42]